MDEIFDQAALIGCIKLPEHWYSRGDEPPYKLVILTPPGGFHHNEVPPPPPIEFHAPFSYKMWQNEMSSDRRPDEGILAWITRIRIEGRPYFLYKKDCHPITYDPLDGE